MRAGASKAVFFEGAIQEVAKVGIENLHTKKVAEHTEYSEAMLFRCFSGKNELLQETFLEVDGRISRLFITEVRNMAAKGISFEDGFSAIWHKMFRYLIEHWEETLFLIRFRYCTLYNDDVRARRGTYNGDFDKFYQILDKHYQETAFAYRGFLVNYLFELTLSFAEKVVTGRLTDTPETEEKIWFIVNGVVMQVNKLSDAAKTDMLH